MLAAAILVAAALTASAPANGIPAESVQQLDTCVDAAAAVDLQVKDCYAALAQREDARLNAGWKRLIRAVGGNATRKGRALVAKQKAWLAYRDTACLHLMIDGGTLDRLQSQICYAHLVTTRADEITEFANTYQETYSPD